MISWTAEAKFTLWYKLSLCKFCLSMESQLPGWIWQALPGGYGLHCPPFQGPNEARGTSSRKLEIPGDRNFPIWKFLSLFQETGNPVWLAWKSDLLGRYSLLQPFWHVSCALALVTSSRCFFPKVWLGLCVCLCMESCAPWFSLPSILISSNLSFQTATGFLPSRGVSSFKLPNLLKLCIVTCDWRHTDLLLYWPVTYILLL